MIEKQIITVNEDKALHVLRFTDHEYVLMRCENEAQLQAMKDFKGERFYIEKVQNNIEINAYAVARKDLLNDKTLDACVWYTGERDLRFDRKLSADDKYFVAGRDIEEELKKRDGIIVYSSRDMFIGAEIPEAYYSYQFDCAVIGKQALSQLYKLNSVTDLKNVLEGYSYYSDLQNYLQNNKLSDSQKALLLDGKPLGKEIAAEVSKKFQDLTVIYDFSENKKLASWYNGSEDKKELHGVEAARFLDRFLAVDQGIENSPVQSLGYDKTYFEVRLQDGSDTLSLNLRLDLDGKVFGKWSSEIENFAAGLSLDKDLIEGHNTNRLVSRLKDICKLYRQEFPEQVAEDRKAASLSLNDYFDCAVCKGKVEDLKPDECLFVPQLPMSHDFARELFKCAEIGVPSFYADVELPVFKLLRSEIAALYDVCAISDSRNYSVAMIKEFEGGLLFNDLQAWQHNFPLTGKDRAKWINEERQNIVDNCEDQIKSDPRYSDFRRLSGFDKKQSCASYNLKKELKKNFPEVNFSVRICNYDLQVSYGEPDLPIDKLNEICSKYSSSEPQNIYEMYRKEAFTGLFGSVYGGVYASYDPHLRNKEQELSVAQGSEEDGNKRIYIRPNLQNDDREVLKQIPGHQYNAKVRIWSVTENTLKKQSEDVIKRVAGMKCYSDYPSIFKGKEMSSEDKQNLFAAHGNKHSRKI